MEVNEMFYDKDFRNKIRRLDKDSLAQLMVDYASDARIKVLANTKDTFYFVIPTESGSLDLELQSVQAGAVSSIYTFASFGCASSTISTAGSASTAAPQN